MPLIVLLVVAVLAGLAAYGLATWCQRVLGREPATAAAVGVAVDLAADVAGPGRVRRFLRARRDPRTRTGLLLSLAGLAVIGGGLVIAVLAYLVRGNDAVLDVDAAAARWGSLHASAWSTDGLQVVTRLGQAWTIVAFGAALVLVELVRAPSRYVIPFVLAVTLGDGLITWTIKDLAARARPTLNPIAESLGPSFPSGHTSSAAAFYACAALLLGRHLGLAPRRWLAAGAVAIAVGVAASRVLLDVHWLSDTVAGLALGWGWFALCAIAFGGRLLRFGAGSERATAEARRGPSPRPLPHP